MRRRTLPEVVEMSIAARADMRQLGDQDGADIIRDGLLEHGIRLDDHADGSTTWDFDWPTDGKTLSGMVENQIWMRSYRRRIRDWEGADQIRQFLLRYRIILEDHADGSTTWRRR